MFKNLVTAAVILSTVFLVGCAGQGFYVAAQDGRNPYNFIQVAGRIPTPLALCIKDDGDIFKMSCPSGQLNMRKVDGNRQYSCVQRDGKTIEPSKVWVPHLTREVCPMGIVDHNQNDGNQFGNGGGSPQGLFPYMSKTDCPQVPVGGGMARCQ
ncbi:MAG: hypothetical protein NTW35_02540 [Candidatus Nomurabacteria bacterium]|nr:hypothetical protein [Candidatus Nomurabacteria bacterium]